MGRMPDGRMRKCHNEETRSKDEKNTRGEDEKYMSDSKWRMRRVHNIKEDEENTKCEIKVTTHCREEQ